MIIRKPFEFVSSLTLIMWGLWMANPFFHVYDVGTVYRMMEKVAPEWVWGVFVLSVGIIKLVVMRTNKIKLRVAVSFLVMFTFATLAVFFMLGNWRAVATPMYLSFVITSWFSYVEVLMDKKYPPLELHIGE